MKNKKLLAIVLLSLSFCFVSAVGYGKTGQVLIINKGLGAEVILAIASIALVIVTAKHLWIVWKLTSKSNTYLRINIVCSKIATRVSKRFQCEADVTKIRLKRIELKANETLETPAIKEEISIKKELKRREKQYSDTIIKTQKEIDELEKELTKLEGKLENG